MTATRSDDELRRKEAELQLIKEKAQWDHDERQKLEQLRMTLEAEKRKVEEALLSERALALEKDALLDRSKQCEAELEQEIAVLQADLETLDSQLDRAVKLQKESDGKSAMLRQAFDEAAEHLIRLEEAQKSSTLKEESLNQALSSAKEDIFELEKEKARLSKLGDDLRSLSSQREEDICRSKDRMDALTKEFETKANLDLQDR